MKALVTGPEHPAAIALIKILVAKRDEVFVFYRNELPKEVPKEAKSFKIDISDYNHLITLLDRLQPNVLFHLDEIKDSDDDDEIKEINLGYTKELINAAEELDKSPSFVFASTSEVYGKPLFLPINEEHPIKPFGEYAKSKSLAESLVRESAKRGFRSLNLRIFNIISTYGDCQTSDMLRQYMKAKKDKKKEMTVPEFKEDVIDAADAARAFLAAELKATPGEDYNICSGKLITSKEIADALISNDKSVKISFSKPKDAKEKVGDNRKFFRTTGWRPLVEIESSLKEISGL